MAARHKATVRRDVDAARRAYLGEVFLKHYPADTGCIIEPQVEILPEIIAANCLGITYGDPGPVLGGEWCRECWGERYVWLGNGWGLRHTGGTMNDCQHACHEDQVWLAASA